MVCESWARKECLLVFGESHVQVHQGGDIPMGGDLTKDRLDMIDKLFMIT
jgi:hypothetical protein